MRRLYLQIYGTVLAVVLIFGVLTSSVWWVAMREWRDAASIDRLGQLAQVVLPADGLSPEQLQDRVTRLAAPFAADAALFDASGRTLAATGASVPLPQRSRGSEPWARRWRSGRGVVSLELPDGRWLVARLPDRPHPPAGGVLIPILLLALATAMGSYPVVRRLTRRLEALQSGVEDLGRGDLGTRIPVQGRDEIAHLAERFNWTAERIEALVEDKKKALAMVSHELRTPLARIRVAVELMESPDRPDLRGRIERDIEELDGLIGELLMNSRLDSPELELENEPVELLALLAEVCASFDVPSEGESMLVRGDARLLRRLMQNLLENARRYAGGATHATLTRSADGGCLLAISDAGPGVPAEERERIFEPFYRPSGAGESRQSTQGEGGLGLALVRQIAERHGGSVRCVDADGGGTRFEVCLPVALPISES